MTHEALIATIADPTIGSGIYGVLVAAVPVVVGGIVRFLLLHVERREEESLRRMVKKEMRKYFTKRNSGE